MIRQSSLPTSYEMLEYIENTSTAYIDCGLKPEYTFDYEIKTNVLTGDIIFGCILKDDNNDFRFFNNNQAAYFDVGKLRISVRLPRITSTSDYFHVKLGNYFIESLLDKGETISGPSFNERMNGAKITNLFLFAKFINIPVGGGLPDGTTVAKGKIWLFNINDNGKPIRKFIPVKRKSDGVIGMYDLVGRKFYTSPNGVAFTGG